MYFLPLLSLVSTLVAALNQQELQANYESSGKCKGVNILELDIKTAHNYFIQQKLKPKDLVECYLNRIKLFNPVLNSVIEVNPNAIEQASKLNLKDINKLPLFGFYNTTAGSYALLDAKPHQEADVVKKLRAAGAIILGKANLSEFANFRSHNDLAGWSGRGNQTHNPYVLSATASGSSTGSSVSTAANLCLVSVGSETHGSIVGPSSLTATVGFKPTVGVVSSKGVIPIAPSQDSVGPITRNIENTIIMTKVMMSNSQIYNKDYYGDLRRKPFKIAPLGGYFFKELKDQLPAINNFIQVLKKDKKVEIVDNFVVNFSNIDSEKESRVLKYEFKHYLNEYLKNEASGNLTLSKIIEYNENNADKELKFDQKTLKEANESGSIEDESYIKDRDENKLNAQNDIDNALKSMNLDAFLVPSDFRIGSEGPSAVAGYPIITLPLGIDQEGIPFGISLYTTKNKDLELLNIAKYISKYTKKRDTPSFKSCCTSIDLSDR